MNEEPLAQTDETLPLIGETSLPQVDAPPAVNRQGAVAAIAAAIKAGDISPRDARELRARLGISTGFFTKKKTNKAKAKHKARIAKASRRRNRGLGKGEKRNSGTGRAAI